MVWIGFFIMIIGMGVFIFSYHMVEKNAFYEHSPLLFSLGIYTFGQGLVIAPFWVLVGVLSTFLLRPIDILKLYLLFHALRSLYEVWFWSVHEASKKLTPPLMGHLEHVDTGEHIMLYQLAQLLIVTTLIFLLLNLPLV